MALTKVQKTVQLQELKDKFQKSASIIFIHYIGMNVADVSDFRRQVASKGAEMKVAKKTLMRIAAEQLNLPVLEDEKLDGPVACIFSYEDPLSGAQIALSFSKSHPQISFVGGIFEGKFLSKEEASALATIPSREILLATFAGMIRSPLVTFASMLNSPLIGFARALQELEKKGGLNPKAAAPAPVASTPAASVPAASEEIANANPAQTDATGDPVDLDTGGRTEVVLAEELKEPSHTVEETPTEAASEGEATA